MERHGHSKWCLTPAFTGYLVLPQGIISRLGLSFSGQRSVILASGERRSVDAYTGSISWHGQRRDVIVLESISESLLGMALLSGSKVILDVRADGHVVIEDAGEVLS